MPAHAVTPSLTPRQDPVHAQVHTYTDLHTCLPVLRHTGPRGVTQLPWQQQSPHQLPVALPQPQWPQEQSPLDP